MKSVKVIREYGTIHNASDYPGIENKDTFNEIWLSEKDFVNLKDFVAENRDEDNEIEQAFSYHRLKRRDYIKVKNYVGLIETPNHTTIEILPKVYMGEYVDGGSRMEIEQTRRIFLRMLKCLRDAPFKSITEAQLKVTKFPILEVFITNFLHELEKLIKIGINKHYVRFEENRPFLKGKLIFHEQIKHNSLL